MKISVLVFFDGKKTRMDTTTWSNMFSVRISSHNPFTNFGVTVGGPTMKFADLRAKAKPKACRKAAGSSSSSGGSSPGLDDSLQDMMDHSPGRPPSSDLIYLSCTCVYVV